MKKETFKVDVQVPTEKMTLTKVMGCLVDEGLSIRDQILHVKNPNPLLKDKVWYLKIVPGKNKITFVVGHDEETC